MSNKQDAVSIKKRWKLFLPLLLCLFFGLTLYFSLGKDPHTLGLVQQGKPFPDFTAQNLLEPAGNITKSDLTGNIILLNVWASWCGTCKIEHPFLLELAKQPEISLYGLNYRDRQQSAVNVLNSTGNPYKKVIFDPEGKLALEIGVYGTPETYLLDEQGVIRFRYSGELNQELWQNVFVPEITAMMQNGGRS